jgi:DNA-binding phage protein
MKNFTLTREVYIAKLKRDISHFKKGGLGICSKKIGLSYSQLYRIINNISQGTLSSWEKIFNYYSKKSN